MGDGHDSLVPVDVAIKELKKKRSLSPSEILSNLSCFNGATSTKRRFDQQLFNEVAAPGT